MCSHTEGTLTIWSLKSGGKPVETIRPHSECPLWRWEKNPLTGVWWCLVSFAVNEAISGEGVGVGEYLMSLVWMSAAVVSCIEEEVNSCQYFNLYCCRTCLCCTCNFNPSLSWWNLCALRAHVEVNIVYTRKNPIFVSFVPIILLGVCCRFVTMLLVRTLPLRYPVKGTLAFFKF